MVISAVFSPFLWASVVFTKFTNVRNVVFTMRLLKFEVRISEKMTEFSLKVDSQL